MDLENGTSNGMMELDEEREEEEIMDLDDVPVTQEDAWAVIRYGIAQSFIYEDGTAQHRRRPKITNQNIDQMVI